jgi:hypothetical protein
MKFMIQGRVSVEKGGELDARGGPGPFFAHFAERFKPEACYIHPVRREFFAVCELDEAQITEVMILCSRLGEYPTVSPVVALRDFRPVAEAAMMNAKKSPI